MERSGSWPDFNIISESDYKNGCSPEITIYRLRKKLSDCETQKTSLSSQLQRLLEEKKNLHVHNLKLIESNRCNLQQILILESRKNQLMLQQEELKNQAANLQKDLEESEREKGKISQDLGIWREAFEIIEQSKKEIEKHMEMFKEATARDRNEIENKTLKEFSFFRQQLKAMEHRLKAEEEITEGVKALRIENNKMQAKISGLTQHNCELKLYIDKVQRSLEDQKNQNVWLQEEIEEMEKQSYSCASDISNSKQLLKLFVPESGTLTTQHTTAVSDIVTKTPPPLFLSKEIEERLPSLTSKCHEDENQWDPLEEYIRLSVMAVKIHFPNVDVSEDKLIEKAKAVPFYNVHDVLSSYMEEKLKRQERRNKEMDKRQRTSVYHRQQTSVFRKIRGFCGCGAFLDNSQCNESEIDLLRKLQRRKLVTTMRFSV